MVKKIKDLTIIDLMNKCSDERDCNDCPFDNVLCGEQRFSLITYLDKIELEKEVEVNA